MNPEPADPIQEGFLELMVFSMQAVQADAPSSLYHFTDATGLIGILSDKRIRLTLATSLNDASELEYARELACTRLLEKRVQLRTLNPADVVSCLRGADLVEPLSYSGSRVFVASFSADIERAIHWLHYGRSGRGVAIELDSGGLTKPKLSLGPVRYDEAEQVRIIDSILNKADETANQLLKHAFEGQVPGDLVKVVSQYAATLLSLWVFPVMKHPAFKDEAEWRLFAVARSTPGEGLATRFKSSEGRIIPYIEVDFEPLSVRRIILGGSSPMGTDDQALAILLCDALGHFVPVAVSPVRVRP